MMAISVEFVENVSSVTQARILTDSLNKRRRQNLLVGSGVWSKLPRENFFDFYAPKTIPFLGF